MRYVFYLSISFVLLFPAYTYASVLISEIMYDLPGSDTGREWIEVTNTGAQSIDLTLYKFFEGDSNHALVSFRGSPTLPTNSYAVIVEDTELFLTDYPSYNGSLFDSSWSSFSNEGEIFEIRDSEGTILDHIAYTKEMGALGDGMSLHRNGNSLLSQNPSPGFSGSGTQSLPPQSSSPSGGLSSGSSASGASTTFYGIPKATPDQPFSVSAQGNRILTEQLEYIFDAKVTGVPSTALQYVQYRWNFGNGEEVLEKLVRYRYLRKGEYVVILTAISGGKTVSDRIVVTVAGSEVSISSMTDEGVELNNTSSRDVDLSGWYVRAGKKNFSFPQNTWLLGGKSFLLETRISKLVTNGENDAELFFPNGVVASRYSMSLNAAALVEFTAPEITALSQTKSKATQTKEEVEAAEKKEIIKPPVPKKKQDKELVVSPFDFGVANVVATVDTQEQGSPLMMPIAGLLALIGISSGAVILMRQSKNGEIEVSLPEGSVKVEKSAVSKGKTPIVEQSSQRGGTNEADSYTIIE